MNEQQHHWKTQIFSGIIKFKDNVIMGTDSMVTGVLAIHNFLLTKP